MEERYLMVESNANIYLITLLFIIVSVIGCWFQQIEVLIFWIPVWFVVYLIRKIKSQYRIKFFSNKLIVTRRKNRYSYKNLYSTEMEDVVINYNELSFIEIRRIWDVFLALSPIPRRLKNKEIIIHLKTWSNIQIKWLNWSDSFEKQLSYDWRKIILYSYANWEPLRQSKQPCTKILKESVFNNQNQIVNVDKYIQEIDRKTDTKNFDSDDSVDKTNKIRKK